MKKTLTIVMAVILVSASLLTGVFAMYSTSIDNVNQGDVVAKNFTLVANESQSFGENVKIAPSGSHSSKFTVANFEGNTITETAMKVTITLTFSSEIAPLTISLSNGSDVVIASTTNSVNTYEFDFDANAEQSKEFTVTVAWPAGDYSGSDNAYIANTASFNVKVVGVQVGA